MKSFDARYYDGATAHYRTVKDVESALSRFAQRSKFGPNNYPALVWLHQIQDRADFTFEEYSRLYDLAAEIYRHRRKRTGLRF